MSRAAGNAAVYRPKVGTGQKVAYTATAGTVSNSIGTQTRIVCAWATSDAYLRFDGGDATTSDAPIPKNQIHAFAVTPGTKVSAVQIFEAGTLYMYEAE